MKDRRSRYCSRRCRSRAGHRLYPSKPEPWNDRRRDNYHRRKARKRGAVVGEAVLLEEIAERDRWRCGICRLKVNPRWKWPNPKSPSLDHIVPLADIENTEHSRRNVQLAHLGCNLSRGNRGGGEQLALIG